ncbi:MAG: outer membrane protein assembly factor BamD, partial [Phycisphaerales bacterium JB038]
TLALLLAAPLGADDFVVDEEGAIVRTAEPEAGSAAAWIAEIRRLLAEEKNAAAEYEARKFIKQYEKTREPRLAEAILLHGDANVARGRYYAALFDYERIAKEFNASEQFVPALEREYEIALLFANGLKRRYLGFRVFSAEDEAAELLIRIQERLPSSQLAERAGIALADYYYRKRMMRLAIDAYDLFLRNYPKSRERAKAMQRKIYSHIATFKGPQFDASGLENARLEILDFKRAFPVEAREAGIDDSLVGWVNDSAADKLLETADWYLRQQDITSARYTLKRLLKRHPNTTAGRQALQLMIDRGWMPAPVQPGLEAGSAAAKAVGTETNEEASP